MSSHANCLQPLRPEHLKNVQIEISDVDGYRAIWNCGHVYWYSDTGYRAADSAITDLLSVIAKMWDWTKKYGKAKASIASQAKAGTDSSAARIRLAAGHDRP